MADDAAVSDVAEFDVSGNVDEVVARVGDDPVRAAAALAAEQEKEHPRKTLVETLEKVGGAAHSVDESSSHDELVAAAASRGINMPEDTEQLNDEALLTVIRQVDATAASAGDSAVPNEQLDIVAEVAREAAYQSPEYAEAQERGYFGPDDQGEATMPTSSTEQVKQGGIP